MSAYLCGVFSKIVGLAPAYVQLLKKKRTMTEKELRELFQDLERCGLQPMLCDTPVALYDSRVPCGEPTACSDDIVEREWIPRELLSTHPEYMVAVRGDSMAGAGIESGDIVKIMGDTVAQDGDIVLACIDGDYTLKTFCQDDEGQAWLIPQNERYRPILLTERSNVRIYGRVTEIVKQAPRMKFSECMRTIRKAQLQATSPKRVTREQTETVVREVAPMVQVGRQWYAVYRPLVQRDVIAVEDYDGFISLVKEAVPEHEHMTTVDELQRMAVGSFRKIVSEWNPKNAPVQGKRFKDYQAIGLRTLELLTPMN